MHDCGLLGRMLPEFQAISWRVVRDFYHKYTVDEHTLLTIRNLERLSVTDRSAAGSASAAPRRAARAELLVLALLLHDVGKWRDDDHASRACGWRARRSTACTWTPRRATRCSS
jgi:[protein-PII] uridylyltransferase